MSRDHTTGERRAGDVDAAPLSIGRSKLIRTLHRRKGRQVERAFLAEGERLLEELSRASAGVRFLFGVSERLPWLASLFPDTPLFAVTGRQLDLFATEAPQGVGAVVDIPEPPSLPELLSEPGPILYLDALGDPGNVGTIIRTAVWFGIDRIVLGASSVDPYNPKVVRATMGGIFSATVVEGVEAERIVESGLPVVALDGRAMEVLGEAALPHHAVYVVGSEAHGVSAELAAAARTVSIPGAGGVESLNAAIAAGILCYELSRPGQRS